MVFHVPETGVVTARAVVSASSPTFSGDGGKAKFNGTPQEWRLLPLDPACEPRQLVAPLLNASRHAVPSAEQLVIMFFGDRSV